MAEALNLLDQALEIGHQELKFLVEGEVDDAYEAAEQRGVLTDRALEIKESVSLDEMLDKLTRLKNLQGQLTSEAKKLHASMKQDILRTNKESVRFKGYGKAARGTPLFNNSYINKVG